MPQATYYKLSDEKRDRVYQAVLNEYTRVPLEEVSVKNIVNEAGIPRGSFYQYFLDKEGAFRHLVNTIYWMNEEAVFTDMMDLNIDLFQLIKGVFKNEVKMCSSHNVSLRSKLLRQATQSARGMVILFEEISTIILENAAYKTYWEKAGLDHLSLEERRAVIHLLFTSLKESLLMITQDLEQILQAEQILDMKIAIIQQGAGIVLCKK